MDKWGENIRLGDDAVMRRRWRCKTLTGDEKLLFKAGKNESSVVLIKRLATRGP